MTALTKGKFEKRTLMKTTIDLDLQQAIAFYQEGKLQDAERLYRAILQSQPQ